ncbi:MAG: hypothetical protein ABSB56_07070 [Nitrososphaerales archaeon]|jgi:hypothetical protein
MRAPKSSSDSREGVKEKEDKKVAREIAALRADIARVKGEIARSGAEEKTRLEAELGKRHEKLHIMLEHAKQRSER